MSKERLTERHGELVCCPQNIECTSICDDCDHMGKMMDKLAEYEDLEEQGLLLRLPCNVGDAIWELCKCDDDVYRIFPMMVKHVAKYGAIRWVKGKEPTVWNIYATSDYTYMYKSFYDIGKTVFLTQSEAEEKLRELEEK